MASCDGTLDGRSYLDWAQDSANGMRVVSTDGKFTFTLQYQPPEMVYLMRYRQEGVDRDLRDERIREISNLRHYVLTLGLANGKGDFLDLAPSDQEKQRLVYYLSYPFQEDIALRGTKGWETPVLYHFERSMDMKTSRTIVLGFEDDGSHAGGSVLRISSSYLGIDELLLGTSENHTKKPRL